MIFSFKYDNARNRRAHCGVPGVLLCILLCSCLSLTTLAQDKADAPRGLVSEFFASASGEFELYADIFTRNADGGLLNEARTLWSQLALQNYVGFFNALSLETELVITMTGPNQQSGFFTTPGVISPKSAFIDFRTFMFTWQGKNTEVKLGKWVAELGLVEIYSPVDRFSARNYSRPQHYNDRGDIQLSLSRFFSGGGRLNLTMLPFNEDFIDPTGRSRWLNSRGDRDFFNQTGASDEERPHHFPEQWGYILTYTGVVEGFDYYVGAHYGPGAYPVIQFTGIVIPPKTQKKYPTATSGMAGLYATKGAWSYYIDLIYQKTHSAEDDTFAKWALGFSYRETKLANRLGLVEIKPILTYSGHKVLEDSDLSKTLINSETARPFPDSLLVKLEFRINEKTLLTLLSSKNFTDDDNSFGFNLIYNQSDSLFFSASSLFMHGRNNTQFGRWRANDFVSIGFNYRF